MKPNLILSALTAASFLFGPLGVYATPFSSKTNLNKRVSENNRYILRHECANGIAGRNAILVINPNRFEVEQVILTRHNRNPIKIEDREDLDHLDRFICGSSQFAIQAIQKLLRSSFEFNDSLARFPLKGKKTSEFIEFTAGSLANQIQNFLSEVQNTKTFLSQLNFKVLGISNRALLGLGGSPQSGIGDKPTPFLEFVMEHTWNPTFLDRIMTGALFNSGGGVEALDAEKLEKLLYSELTRRFGLRGPSEESRPLAELRLGILPHLQLMGILSSQSIDMGSLLIHGGRPTSICGELLRLTHQHKIETSNER